MSIILAVVNQKGGVLKSTSTINIGYCLAAAGKRVLMVDYDPQGSMTISLGYEAEEFTHTVCDMLKTNPEPVQSCICKINENLDFIPSVIDLAAMEMELIARTAREFILSRSLKPIEDEYDYILIDCPPQLSILTINALTAANKVLIPCKTDYLSYRGLEHLQNTVREVKELVNPDLEILGVIATLYEKRIRDHNDILEIMKKKYDVLGVIKKAADATRGIYDGMTVCEKMPKSDVAIEYKKISEIILKGEK